MSGSRFPAIPPAFSRFVLGPLPLAPLRLALARLVASIARRHPGLLARLGEEGRRRFLIDPSDLPFVFLLVPRDAGGARIDVLRRGRDAAWNARIAGPLAALVSLANGASDGDALFFAGEIAIEGDTEAVVALRNAIDDAELDLLAEVAAAFGLPDPRALAFPGVHALRRKEG